jgi:exodeoxyribonuclease VII large subunit
MPNTQEQKRLGKVGQVDAISISELFVKLDLALKHSFSTSLWISGELRDKPTVKNGHCYFDLSDPNSTSGYPPTINCVIWAGNYNQISQQLATKNLKLEKGLVIKVEGSLKYFAGRSSIQLQISNLDIEGLIGEIALARLKLIKKLATEGLIEKNSSIQIPTVPLKIALVGSPGTQGFLDFMTQINSSNFNFEVTQYPVPVQGTDAPIKLATAINVASNKNHDILVLVRGGGSKSDLSAFDKEEVARAVCNCSVPVFCGIGHTEDSSVVDEVASKSFITPTECGQFIVKMVKSYFDDVHRKIEMILTLISYKISESDSSVAKHRANLLLEGNKAVESASNSIELNRRNLQLYGERTLKIAQDKMASARSSLVSLASRIVTNRQNENSNKMNILFIQGNHFIDQSLFKLRIKKTQLVTYSSIFVESATNSVDSKLETIRAFDPINILKRGYAVVRGETNKLIKSISQVEVGTLLNTELNDGTVISQVSNVKKKGK